MYPHLYVYYSDNIAQDRQKLDRRRLETAHFRYAMLVVAMWYPSDIGSEVKFAPDINETLLEFTPLYHLAFHRTHSGLWAHCMLLIEYIKYVDLNLLIILHFKITIVRKLDVALFWYWMVT